MIYHLKYCQISPWSLLNNRQVRVLEKPQLKLYNFRDRKTRISSEFLDGLRFKENRCESIM